MATMTRLDIRLDEEIKSKAERASTLLGRRNLTEYLVKLMDEDASRVIAEHENIILEDSVFDQFMTACNKASKPNKALKDALKKTRENGL
ncbi:MAG: DUF1778 domain-containing protein [Lentisphaeraceae bacterium]|nr:DUF1778 domain-containing protein [Lentisphaeraceae bacterium]